MQETERLESPVKVYIQNSAIHLALWRFWRSQTRVLASVVVKVLLGGRESGSFSDEELDTCRQTQNLGLLRILESYGQGQIVTHSADVTADVKEFGFLPVKRWSSLDVLWTSWFPMLHWRRHFEVSNLQDIERLTLSLAWTEYNDTFVLFSKKVDDLLITHFVQQKWSDDDQFIAIIPVGDFPYWHVVSNHLSQSGLIDFLGSVFG